MTEIRKPMEGCFGSAEIFSERNLRGIGRAAEPFRRNGAVAEPWKARGAEAWTAGLAKVRDGRAVGGIVLKITGGCVCTKVFFLV